MEKQISRLRITEQVEISIEALALLHTTLGAGPSQQVIERASVEVAERLCRTETAMVLGDFDKLRKNLRGLRSIGEQLGFALLSMVAADAMRCIDAEDMIALSAVIGRLIRVGDASLAAAIDNNCLRG
ncbi:MAG: hypothetical protein KDA67_01340 [Rhodobacteraceae bacterium]|nr:hypothetical protein [Paracoccaceae bacterium]